MNAFITGSRRYGTPRAGSDLDLVVLVDEKTWRLLIENCGGDHCGDYTQIRFGNLNIVVTSSAAEFGAWATATTELEARAPVTRDEAVVAVKAALREAKQY